MDTGIDWVDGRRICRQVKAYNHMSHDGRIAHGVPIRNLIQATVIDRNGGVLPYLPADDYWYMDVTVTRSELISRIGSSNPSYDLNIWVIFEYTKA